MGQLTVRENLQFSASLRLPKGTARQKRDERIQEVITELGLTKCADTKVCNTSVQRNCQLYVYNYDTTVQLKLSVHA